MSVTDDLIQCYLDDTLPPERFAELNEWVKRDPANARALAEAARLHDRLRDVMEAARRLGPDALDRPAAPSAEAPRRRWRRAAALAASLVAAAVVAAVLWRLSPGPASAATELDRLMQAPAGGDRTYRISSLDDEPEAEDERRPPIDGATLHIRHPDRYVLVRRSADGGRFVTGSDGERSWSVRPGGAVRVSTDPLRFRGPLPGHQHGVPFVDLRSDLVQLRDAYNLEILPPRGDLRGLLAERKPDVARGPRAVELWYDWHGPVIRRMVFRGLPRARGGPHAVAVDLVEQGDLGADFFRHQSHHAPDRRVIEED